MSQAGMNTHCSCGRVNYNIVGKPLLRAFCHCSICQAVNKAPYADITLFRYRDVVTPGDVNLEFKSHKFPPILKRGKCVACDNIAIEYLQLVAIPRMVIVPSDNVDDKSLIPAPALHIFYESRVADIEDSLPKYKGYLSSQLAFGRKLIDSLLHN